MKVLLGTLQHILYAFWPPCISNSPKEPLCFEDYDSTKFRPADGKVDSSPKLVLRLRLNEIPTGSRRRRLQYYTCTTIQRNSGRLTEASIPVLNLYYDLTKFRPAHGNVDSSTKLVLRFNEIPAGSRKCRFQCYTCTTI